MDGIDAAMVKTDGVQIFEFGRLDYIEFSDEEVRLLRQAQGKWPGEDEAILASDLITKRHGDLASRFPEAELIGFHGQTLAHDPQNGRTHQAGDGRELARHSGKPVVWDFRTADVKLGGQGAPLAPFYHFALAKYIPEGDPLVFLNLGGIGNVTWVNPAQRDPQNDGALLAFDTGPANAPINDLVMERLGLPHDESGSMALSGQVGEDIVTLAYEDHVKQSSCRQRLMKQYQNIFFKFELAYLSLGHFSIS